MGVKLQSSSGGSVEIAAPVTASNYTLTAPAVTSTIDTLARAGNVLQVVQGSTTTSTSTSSTSYVSTTLTATITPSLSSSKVLVSISGVVASLLLVYSNGYGTIYRNGANILGASGFANSYSETGRQDNVWAGGYLDSPATTSATTYTLYVRCQSVTDSLQICRNGSLATITLMEIAG